VCDVEQLDEQIEAIVYFGPSGYVSPQRFRRVTMLRGEGEAGCGGSVAERPHDERGVYLSVGARASGG